MDNGRDNNNINSNIRKNRNINPRGQMNGRGINRVNIPSDFDNRSVGSRSANNPNMNNRSVANRNSQRVNGPNNKNSARMNMPSNNMPNDRNRPNQNRQGQNMMNRTDTSSRTNSGYSTFASNNDMSNSASITEQRRNSNVVRQVGKRSGLYENPNANFDGTNTNYDNSVEKEDNKVMKNIEEIFKVDKDNKKVSHNQEMSKVVICTMLIFLGMFVYIGYFMTAKAPDEVNNKENAHIALYEKNVDRGTIYDRTGKTVLAETKDHKRTYPYNGRYAHLVGAVGGKYRSGMEERYSISLLTSSQSYMTQLVNELKGDKQKGNDLVLTVDNNVQEAAEKAISNYDEAVAIAMDPTTGEVMAMISKPDFDPNNVENELAEEDQHKNDKGYETPFMNRATLGAYAPGSTFKIITTLSYLRQNKNDINSFSYKCTGEAFGLNCHAKNGHGTQTLREAFVNSCNTAFADIVVGGSGKFDIDKYKKDASSLFIGSGIPYRYGQPYKGNFELSQNSSDKEKAHAAIGQAKTTIAPLHNAMITCAIANGGDIMKPKLVKKIQTPGGKVIEEVKDEKYENRMTKEETDILSDFMKGVCDDDKAVFASNKFEMKGKTGTAEIDKNGNRLQHCWFTGYAEKDGKKLVTTVIIPKQPENSYGGKVAGPVAMAMANAYFQ